MQKILLQDHRSEVEVNAKLLPKSDIRSERVKDLVSICLPQKQKDEWIRLSHDHTLLKYIVEKTGDICQRGHLSIAEMLEQ
jgi:hypothetical protein